MGRKRKEVIIMKNNYTKSMKWAVVSFVSRTTQDDRKDKLQVCGLFGNPVVAEDSFIQHLPNKETRRYIVHVDDLEEFERFYNVTNDLRQEFGSFSADQEKKFRTILNLQKD